MWEKPPWKLSTILSVSGLGLTLCTYPLAILSYISIPEYYLLDRPQPYSSSITHLFGLDFRSDALDTSPDQRIPNWFFLWIVYHRDITAYVFPSLRTLRCISTTIALLSCRRHWAGCNAPLSFAFLKRPFFPRWKTRTSAYPLPAGRATLHKSRIYAGLPAPSLATRSSILSVAPQVCYPYTTNR